MDLDLMEIREVLQRRFSSVFNDGYTIEFVLEDIDRVEAALKYYKSKLEKRAKGK